MESLPRTYGPYEIVRRLGVGGMAETFLALRRGPAGFEQRVCLKRVLPAYAEDEAFTRRFEREARIAASLRHAGIVSVVEFGRAEGSAYLALELVDGVDLRDDLASRDDRRLPAAVVARVGVDLAQALAHAHAAGVVHRDISPANVMLSRTGEVKLTDFGVAKWVGQGGPTTTTGAGPKGKIAYMAPEQIRGEALDGRADLFGLGVLLFEALTGERPFRGAHDVEIMRRVVDGERPRLADLAPDAPAALVSCIGGLLHVDRDARPPDAGAVVAELARVPGLAGARRWLRAGDRRAPRGAGDAGARDGFAGDGRRHGAGGRAPLRGARGRGDRGGRAVAIPGEPPLRGAARRDAARRVLGVGRGRDLDHPGGGAANRSPRARSPYE